MKTNRGLFSNNFIDFDSQKREDEPIIAWSSSDSEDLHLIVFNKRKKVNRKLKRNLRIVENLDVSIQPINLSGNIQKIHPSSPILSEKTFNILESKRRTSPILNSNKSIDSKLYEGAESPILSKFQCGKIKNFKKKLKFGDSHYKQIFSCIESQNIIIDEDSQSIGTPSTDDIKIVESLSPKGEPTDNDSINSSAQSPAITKDFLKNESSEFKLIRINCDENIKVTKRKKLKKNGLALRLYNLIKKQKNAISLWQHEKFLAINSKILINNHNYHIFRINKCNFEFGTVWLEVMEWNTKEIVYVVINNKTVNSLKENSLLKLYQPYYVYECGEIKYILNVSKYEIEIVS